MQDTTSEGGQAIPDRPRIVTPTDEWLSRISDQLERLLPPEPTRPAAPAKKAPAPRKRTEVRGQ